MALEQLGVLQQRAPVGVQAPALTVLDLAFSGCEVQRASRRSGFCLVHVSPGSSESVEMIRVVPRLRRADVRFNEVSGSREIRQHHVVALRFAWQEHVHSVDSPAQRRLPELAQRSLDV